MTTNARAIKSDKCEPAANSALLQIGSQIYASI